MAAGGNCQLLVHRQPRPVVPDAQLELILEVGRLDVDRRPRRVPTGVGETLLSDSVGGELHHRVDLAGAPAEYEAGCPARRLAGRVEELVQLPEPWLISGPAGFGIPLEQTLTGAFVGVLVLVILATLYVTGEYRRGLANTTFSATPYYPQYGYYPLGPWEGLLVLCAYAAVALGLAAYLLQKRDA